MFCSSKHVGGCACNCPDFTVNCSNVMLMSSAQMPLTTCINMLIPPTNHLRLWGYCCDEWQHSSHQQVCLTQRGHALMWTPTRHGCIISHGWRVRWKTSGRCSGLKQINDSTTPRRQPLFCSGPLRSCPALIAECVEQWVFSHGWQ